MLAVRVNVAVPPTRRSTFALMSPEPDGVHEDPADATQVQLAPSSDPGSVSVTVAPVIADGPVGFDATIV